MVSGPGPVESQCVPFITEKDVVAVIHALPLEDPVIAFEDTCASRTALLILMFTPSEGCLRFKTKAATQSSLPDSSGCGADSPISTAFE